MKKKLGLEEELRRIAILCVCNRDPNMAAKRIGMSREAYTMFLERFRELRAESRLRIQWIQTLERMFPDLRKWTSYRGTERAFKIMDKIKKELRKELKGLE